ncbi:hypothetical protein V1477_001286 [Vespula maculifrons]|uniref:Uncharacterized protein n=1 Tax=Vespula maculifrons TaxID=7453 RepID=A0ABD2CZM1_VESMC
MCKRRVERKKKKKKKRARTNCFDKSRRQYVVKTAARLSLPEQTIGRVGKVEENPDRVGSYGGGGLEGRGGKGRLEGSREEFEEEFKGSADDEVDDENDDTTTTTTRTIQV